VMPMRTDVNAAWTHVKLYGPCCRYRSSGQRYQRGQRYEISLHLHTSFLESPK
jgi:hypothetical protein